MPLYWTDDGAPRQTPDSAEARGREIAALLNEHAIPWDAPTVFGLVRLTWSVAVELAFEWLTLTIAAGRPTTTDRALRTIPRL